MANVAVIAMSRVYANLMNVIQVDVPADILVFVKSTKPMDDANLELTVCIDILLLNQQVI